MAGIGIGDIETVKIYANPPVTGNVLVDPIEVVNQFLSNMGLSDSDKHSDPSRGYYYDFNTQGDDYKIRVPYFMPSSDGSQWNVVIQTQYGVTFSDPTGQISFSIDSQGNLNGTLTMDYDFSGPLSRVCSFSSGVITVSEDVAKVLVPAVEGNTADVLMALVNITDITALSPFMIADAISLGFICNPRGY